MHFSLSFASGALLATLATAMPQGQPTPQPTLRPTLQPSAQPSAQPAPEVTIYNKGQYQGEQVRFAANGECKSISPRIESVSIPAKTDVFCQVFNNERCDGEGGRVVIDSVPQFSTEEVYPGIICGVLV